MKDSLIELDGHGVDDSLEAWTREGDDSVYVVVENPWAGDSVSGIGAVATAKLSLEDARRFAQWLLEVTG